MTIPQPDLAGERAREKDAASAGIETRAAVLEIDVDDDELDAVDGGDADDDGIVEDAGAAPLQTEV